MREISIRLPHFHYNCQNEKKNGKKNTVENISELEVPFIVIRQCESNSTEMDFFHSFNVNTRRIIDEDGIFFLIITKQSWSDTKRILLVYDNNNNN